MAPQEFGAKWRGNTSTERQVSQEHFQDVCARIYTVAMPALY